MMIYLRLLLEKEEKNSNKFVKYKMNETAVYCFTHELQFS